MNWQISFVVFGGGLYLAALWYTLFRAVCHFLDGKIFNGALRALLFLVLLSAAAGLLIPVKG